MTKETWSRLLRRLEAVCLVAVMLITAAVPMKTQAAETKRVEEIDFTDFSNWRSGVYYHTNGKYTQNRYRICLNDYVTFSSDKYKAQITDSSFRILVRELNAVKSFLRTVTLSNGQEYEPGNNTVYLAISVYKAVGSEGSMSYEAYESKFENGFAAKLCVVKNTTDSGTGTVPDTDGKETEDEDTWKSVEEIDFTDFSNWRSGVYYHTNGQYTANASRICLKDYVTFQNKEYKVQISDTAYQMLIREMNQDKKLLKSYNLADGATYKPGSNAVYLGISIYKKSESGASYAGYKNLFANGFEAKLTAAEKDSVIENPDEETTVYDILKKMILNADASEKDISAYKMTYSEFYNTICPQLAEELFLEFHSYYNMYPNGKIVGKYMTTCKLENVDSDAKARLARVRASVDTFVASVDLRMSDLEKVLLAHEYVVMHTQYKNDNTISHKAGGPLGNGYGVCDGYAEAMMVLLHEVGIETDMVVSTKMNHAWTYVRLDGYWYHIDPTWDDTQKGTDGMYMHRFLIRNDEEFETIKAARAHSSWSTSVGVNSVSTKYTNWFVHDVAGTMYYYNGMWYYWDNQTNSILCSDIMGKTTKTVVDGTGKDKLKLSGLSGNRLSYYIGTTQYTISL